MCVRVAGERGALAFCEITRVRAGDDVDQEPAPTMPGQAAQAHGEAPAHGRPRLRCDQGPQGEAQLHPEPRGDVAGDQVGVRNVQGGDQGGEKDPGDAGGG